MVTPSEKSIASHEAYETPAWLAGINEQYDHGCVCAASHWSRVAHYIPCLASSQTHQPPSPSGLHRQIMPVLSLFQERCSRSVWPSCPVPHTCLHMWHSVHAFGKCDQPLEQSHVDKFSRMRKNTCL